MPNSERQLATVARDLLDAKAGVGLARIRKSIASGGDPLGEAFCRLRSAETRRRHGAVYTPPAVVDAVVEWALHHAAQSAPPVRIVDPGAGSGRFVLAAARAFPRAALVAVEVDPLAILLLRANAKVLGVDDSLAVLAEDYRSVELEPVDGPTLFLGNPPYVRHHDISKPWKSWFAETAARAGFKASKLAGMHVHFLLKTRELAKCGDFGAFINAAEWLDVNYGDLVRRLLVEDLCGISVHVIQPTAMPFADTATTGAIFNFCVGQTRNGIRLRAVRTLGQLTSLRGGRSIQRSRLARARRWSEFLHPPQARPSGFVELGEMFRVHRGQVTGCNRAWIAGAYPGSLPTAILLPVVTRARELFDAVPELRDAANLRRVVSLPVDLDGLDDDQRLDAQRFLAWAKTLGADKSYVAQHRPAWWAVPLRPPAPILCTYMARRPPAFVRNLCGARHLNIAHGLYPRDPLSASVLDVVSAWLQDNVGVSAGRTYAGGLTKFEPKEVERILVPPPEELHERTQTMDGGQALRPCGLAGGLPRQSRVDSEVGLARHRREIAVASEGEIGAVRIGFVQQVDEPCEQLHPWRHIPCSPPVDHRVAAVAGGIGGVDEVRADADELQFRRRPCPLPAPVRTGETGGRGIDLVAIPDEFAAADTAVEGVAVAS